MRLSRRNFLRTVGAAAATTTVLEFPLAGRLAFAGEPPRARVEGGPILLNSNENAYGPSEKTMAEAQAALALAMRYPDKQYDALRERIAALHRVKTEQIFLGNGSTEILKMAANAFASRGRKLVVAAPTFEAIGFYAQAQGGEVNAIPLRPDHSHDLERMGRGAPDLAYICNPNNPTGTLTPRKEIEEFVWALPEKSYVLMDEAYHHFAVGAPGYESFLDKPLDDPRVMVARTFSKVYGMAGLRLGYGIVPARALEAFRRQRTQDNVNMVSARCGVVALEEQAAIQAAAARNARDREEFRRQAAARKVKLLPSYANFFMMDVGRPVEPVSEAFKKKNILVGRNFHYGNWLRVSLGLPEEMAAFWKAWDEISG